MDITTAMRMGTTTCRTIMLPGVGVWRGITTIIDPEVAASVQMKEGHRLDASDGIILAVHPLAILVRVATTATVVVGITTIIIIITIIMQLVGSAAVIPRSLRAVTATLQNLPDELGNVQLRKVVGVSNN